MKEVVAGVFFAAQLALSPVWAQDSAEQTRQKLAQFLDEWHEDAAHARLAYFDKIAADGVYIGTDKTERWLRDDFKAWAARYFQRPVAWAFKAIKRQIQMTPDQSVLWFDEQLSTQMGICQASGVVRKTAKGFEIVHYQLSMAVPNEVNAAVVELIKKHESASPNAGIK